MARCRRLLRIPSNRAETAAAARGSALAAVAVHRRGGADRRPADRRVAGVRVAPGLRDPRGRGRGWRGHRRPRARGGGHRARTGRPGGRGNHHRTEVPGPDHHRDRRRAGNLPGRGANPGRGRQPAPTGRAARRMALRPVRQPGCQSRRHDRPGDPGHHRRSLHRSRDPPDRTGRRSLPARAEHRRAGAGHGVAGRAAGGGRPPERGRHRCCRGSDWRHGAGRPDRGRPGQGSGREGQQHHRRRGLAPAGRHRRDVQHRRVGPAPVHRSRGRAAQDEGDPRREAERHTRQPLRGNRRRRDPGHLRPGRGRQRNHH